MIGLPFLKGGLFQIREASAGVPVTRSILIVQTNVLVCLVQAL